MTASAGYIEKSQSRLSFESTREWVVALIFISSFFVKIEPAPTDVFGLLAILLFLRSGLHFSRIFAAPLLFMFVYLASAVLTAVPIDRPPFHPDNYNPLQYFTGIAYTSATGIFLAAYIAANPFENYFRVEKAYWIGAAIGAVVGLLLYFQVEPLLTIFRAVGETSYGDYHFRATGGYKDPNVYSTWMVFPAISMMQAFYTRRLPVTLVSLTGFSAILVAILFAFSRGAWIDLILGGTLTTILTICFTPSKTQRGRVVLVTMAGIAVISIAFTILLSMPSFQAVFFDRLTLVKNYDGGETGRFGNWINSIPMLLTLPFGFGPYQFQELFGIAPHNTFLNSFASGGWFGGCAYLVLFATNVTLGFRVIMARSPYQAMAIPVVTTFVVMTLQGIQIDDEHWRHLYWMMGMTWGLAAATLERGLSGFALQDYLRGWNIKQID